MRVFPLALIVFAAILATLSTILFLRTRGEKLRLAGDLALAEARIRVIEPDTVARRNLQATLEKRERDVAETQQKLEQARARVAELDSNLAQGRNILVLREQNERTLNREIASLHERIQAAEEQARELQACRLRIAELENTLALLRRKGLPIPADDGTPPASIQGVGPDNSFVVIDLGTSQGLRAGQKLLVRRGTEVIATVLTSEVREHYSIAQVDPYLTREALRKGDSVLLDQ